MKLSDIIRIWDVIHMNDCGQMMFSDLVRAIDDIVGVQNDCLSPDEADKIDMQPARMLRDQIGRAELSYQQCDSDRREFAEECDV